MSSFLPEVIDLFSGCGGLALGFESEGFRITHGMDLSPEAVKTASYNFHWRYGSDNCHECRDITCSDYEDWLNKIGNTGCIVIGGPPCQAYSLAGRAKLRSLGPNRVNTNDKRGYLYQNFLNYALGLKARAVVMENVPESTDFGGKNIPQLVCEILEENDYKAYWTVLNAADFGVPQVRERVFVLAVKNHENADIDLPVPTHCDPEQKVTSNQRRFSGFSEFSNFRMPRLPENDLPKWVTVKEAFSDLPSLFPDCRTKYFLHKINTCLSYKTDPACEYQKKMRNWYGSSLNGVTANCFRKTLRDFPIFERMLQGDDYLSASRIADAILHDACIKYNVDADDELKYLQLVKNIVPPYDRTKFISKWKKLSETKPSHRVVAHLSVDTYSHIHPWEPRGISVREAARLQSFPDDFLFQNSMGDSFKQIGNAVPPLLAKAVAKQILCAFIRKADHD